MAHIKLTVSLHPKPLEPTSINPTSLDFTGGGTADVTVLDQNGTPFTGTISAVSSDPDVTVTVEGSVLHVTGANVTTDKTVDVDIS